MASQPDTKSLRGQETSGFGRETAEGGMWALRSLLCVRHFKKHLRNVSCDPHNSLMMWISLTGRWGLGALGGGH